MLRHVQKSSLFPARINVAFPPPSRGIEDVAPQLQHQQKLFGKGGLLLGCPCARHSHLAWTLLPPQNTPGTAAEKEPDPRPLAGASLHPVSGHCKRTASSPAKQGWQLPEAKPLCQQFSAALTSLRFKAWPGKVGRTKHLMRVSVHNFEHPGLPWGRGKTESCLFFREAVKGLRQQASIKGSSQQRGLRN